MTNTDAVAATEYDAQRVRVVLAPCPERVTLIGASLDAAKLRFRRDLKSPKRVAPPGLVFELARLDGRVKSASVPNGVTLVYDFAREWGPLGGGLTATIERVPAAELDSSVEPFSTWLSASRLIRALLLLGQQLRDGLRGDDDYWKIIARFDRLGKPQPSLTIRRQRFALIADDLLRRGAVRPRLSWLDGPRALDPTTNIDGDGLVAPLAAQLLLAVSSRRGVGRCGDCGEPFPLRPRQGNFGQFTYCAECGSRGAQRVASRRYRVKKRDQEARR